MKILFISQFKYPHIGGVEKHIHKVGNNLLRLGYSVKYISSEDIKYPKVKFFGLFYIWFWLFSNIKIIKESETIHIHDVFIWYLPFRILFPFKKVYITFHGWEGKYPLPLWNIINKRIANILCNGSIVIGKYIEKYYGIKSKYVIYGGVDKVNNVNFKNKIKNTIMYLGRLENDTGLLEFLNFLKNNSKYKVTFIGDGTFRNECKNYGQVVGNVTNVTKYLKLAEYCVPSGYLSYLEAVNESCKIKTFYNNPLKKDYWSEITKIKTIPTWDDVTNVYLKLWKI